MNFELTNEILAVLRFYIANAQINISTDNFTDDTYKSDFVTIDGKNEVGFEVFDDEIDVFYFTAFHYFHKDTIGLTEGNGDYIERAKDFLVELFENKIKHTEVFKGKKLAYETYSLIYPDNTEKCIEKRRLGGILRINNPFLKKKEVIHIWEFDRIKGCFV